MKISNCDLRREEAALTARVKQAHRIVLCGNKSRVRGARMFADGSHRHNQPPPYRSPFTTMSRRTATRPAEWAGQAVGGYKHFGVSVLLRAFAPLLLIPIPAELTDAE